MSDTTPTPPSVKSLVRPIVLVEDNAMDIDFTLQAFEEAEINNPVIICRDGEEALSFMREHARAEDLQLPVIVLLDLRLPKVTGMEVLHAIRQHPVWRQIPVLVLTTSRECADIAKVYEAGANSYIVKPVDFAAFAHVVKLIKAYWLQINEPPFASHARHP